MNLYIYSCYKTDFFIFIYERESLNLVLIKDLIYKAWNSYILDLCIWKQK